MKRIGNIYENIYDIDNIKMAIMNASAGKRSKYHISKVILGIDKYALELSEQLKHKVYRPSPYKIKIIVDGVSGKRREIFVPRFYPDQVVHWALMLQIESIILCGMYAYSCGSVPGRGTSYGQKHLRRWLDKDYRGTKYCFKMDIKKFYPSVDKGILKATFRKKIKDKDCLWLIDEIIDSVEIGLPIGNYTSQWFSNFFLQDFDHFVKEKLGAKYYVRYVDDVVILDGNKKRLHQMHRDIQAYLESIKLSIKGDWQVFLIDKRAIDFLGLRFYRDRTTLRRRNALRMRRRVKKIAKKEYLTYRDACAVMSYLGWIKRSNSFMFYKNNIEPFISIAKCKERIRAHVLSMDTI
jgi:RNA-directed DNA polymerase